MSWRMKMYHSINESCPTATHCNTLQHTATHCNTLQGLVIWWWGIIQSKADVLSFNQKLTFYIHSYLMSEWFLIRMISHQRLIEWHIIQSMRYHSLKMYENIIHAYENVILIRERRRSVWKWHSHTPENVTHSIWLSPIFTTHEPAYENDILIRPRMSYIRIPQLMTELTYENVWHSRAYENVILIRCDDILV